MCTVQRQRHDPLRPYWPRTLQITRSLSSDYLLSNGTAHTAVRQLQFARCEDVDVSITLSLFHSRLKTFLFRKSFPPQPFLFLLQDSLHGFPGLFTVVSEHICFLLLVFLFLTLFSCRFRAVDQADSCWLSSAR